uniref:Competence protein ComEA helix-hairpin-helix repeat protein n=1 Tax=Solibacter usitatus (strain Ellin6076) TaxID=234267 RepID=Q022M3_SOLUE
MRCRSGALPAAAGFAIGVIAMAAAAQSNEQLLPAGPQREKMVKLCVGCHEIDLVVARRHTREEWDGVVEDMIARGSKGTEEELSMVAEYLSKYLGKVSVNAATAAELQEGLKISDKDARLIVEWREQHGKFKNFEEVRKVPGLDAAKIGDKRGWMSFE